VILLKNSNIKLSEYLNSSEVQCSCDFEECRHMVIHDDLMIYFELLRDLLNTPLIINSGHRCARHNFNVGGVAMSKHLLGAALDIRCPSGMNFDRFKIACEGVFPYVLPYRESGFIHCDVIKRK